MSGPWPHTVPSIRLAFLVEAQLGKMLQPQASGPKDRPAEYLKAGSLPLEDLDDLPTMFASPSDIDQYGVQAGDLVVAEGGDVGRTAFVPRVPQGTIIQNSLHRLRAKPGTDLRYVRYCVESIYESGWLEVLCNKSTFGHLTAEKLASLPVPRWPLGSQQSIADYLDAETARIDALIQKKQRMILLLEDRRRQFLTSGMCLMGFEFPTDLDPDWQSVRLPSGWRVMHLNQCLRQLTNGFVGPTRDILRDEGVRYVQSLHIKNGYIDFERSPYYVSVEWHRQRPRIHLREGDVLIVQTGDIGQVAVVPPAFGEASCHALQIVRVRSEIISGSFLGEYLRTPFGYESLLSRATGALHPHLEGGIRDTPVVVPPLDVQGVLVEKVRNSVLQSESLERTIRSQLGLLTEHRQALITAAVTGQFEVPGVAA